MLKLKRVELQGFKSFCDRSEMRFHGTGVAAIVGPNGCGKSNLSDAISWVLGEQSARTLRGSRMEDVIFAGTRERKPVGLASVTLTLVDPVAHTENALNGFNATTPNEEQNGTGPAHLGAHAKAGEITITRRLYRSGESEYLINGKTARLRDIQDIFMGTGLGPESYAIIEQGRIGQILSTRPADRRAVLEEAAGITRFKTRKRLAEARLESAKANLTRVFDILEEVGRQVNSLKRQAAKARRYAELRAEMITQLRMALSGRFRMLERETAKHAIDLGLAARQMEQLGADVTAREKAATRLLESSYALEASLTEARKVLAENRVEAERVRGRLESQAREISSIEQRLTRGEAEAQDLETRWEHAQAERTECAERLAELAARAETSRSALTAKTGERDRAQSALREQERTIESARQSVLRLLGEASALRNQLAQTDQYLVGVNRDVERLARDEAGAAAEIERAGSARQDLAGRIATQQEELRATAESRKAAETELAARRSRAADARRKLEELRAESSRLKARRDSLGDILLHRSYTTNSVKRLFTAVEKGSAQGLKPVGVLADFLEVDPAWEKATEEFLHDELEYIVVNDWEQAERGVAFMRGDTEGRATFLVHPGETAAQSPDETATRELASAEGVQGRLTEAVRLTNGLGTAPANLLPRLANCYLVADRAAAQQLAPAHPGAWFLLPDGLCYHGRAVSGGKKTGSGPLGLKRELREATAQYTGKQNEFESVQALLQELDREMAHYSDELERLRGVQSRQEREVLALEHDNRKLGEELSRAQSRLTVARNELGRLETDRVSAQERRDRNSQLVAEKEQARAGQEKALAESRAAVDKLGREVALVSEEHSALRVEVAGIEERQRAEMAAKQRIEAQISEMVNRKANLSREAESLGAARARLLSDNLELGGRASVLSNEIVNAEAQVAELAASEANSRSELAEADEGLKSVRHDFQAASEKRSTVELELVRKQAAIKYLEETCRKELHASLEEISEGVDTVPDEAALGEAESRYTDLRGRIEALGPVNIQAEEEFTESQTRYDFLNAQRQDLIDSIRDTEGAISEIDGESRKRFNEAFEAINVNFREMFKTLFSGGIAEMRLTDTENTAESGIDIIAQPPGKKLQSVLLLSGGERALTAMALLMAIFRYQPSPFCVLDEVDAPLDEANIERLTRLIRDMSLHTQFIVITHAKRTMEAAQALYGVTMQEPGVSKLVSVKFSPLPPAPAPAWQGELVAAN